MGEHTDLNLKSDLPLTYDFRKSIYHSESFKAFFTDNTVHSSFKTLFKDKKIQLFRN